MQLTEQRVQDALDHLRQNHRDAVLEALRRAGAGISDDTLRRGRSDLGQWSARELLVLASKFSEVEGALKDHVGHVIPASGTPAEAYALTIKELGMMGELTQTISQALRDAQIEPSEAQGILNKVRDMQSFITTDLVPQLESVARRR